jgi:tetratricopeptide (TPR) repeat protein
LERLSNYRAAKEIALQQGIAFEQDEFWQVRKEVIQKDYGKVVALCAKYLEKHPDTPEYMIDQANALAALKEFDKASQILTRVNQISPPNQEAQWALAELCYERGFSRRLASRSPVQSILFAWLRS